MGQLILLLLQLTMRLLARVAGGAFSVLVVAIPVVTPISATAQQWSGPGAQPVQYITHQIGDGSTPFGGTPPASQTAPADIPTTRSVAGLTYDGAPLPSTTSDELKFRIWCDASHENDQDAILAFQMAKGPHRHTYIGADNADGNSTYTTLRNTPSGSCPGNFLFSQGYWEPSLCAGNRTQWRCLRVDNALFYYARNRTELGTLVSLPNASAFITGGNMSAALIASRAAEVPSGYTGGRDGFNGISCINVATSESMQTFEGGNIYRGLQTPQGGDPWQGRCKAGMILQVNIDAPDCWDGKNRTSPNGRDHFRFSIRENSTGRLYCPDNWYKVPDLQARFRYSLKYDAEYMMYGGMFFSSDRMGDDPSTWSRPGTTPHADWMMGVDPDVWKTIMAKCLGIASPGYTAVGGDCGTYNLGDGRGFNYSVNTGAWRYLLPARQRWWPLKPATKWNGPIHGH